LPVTDGIGPTHPGKLTVSPTRAAGRPPIMTLADPPLIFPGDPGMQLSG
jgi:hypothetical protein